jgi:hypothetical protein
MSVGSKSAVFCVKTVLLFQYQNQYLELLFLIKIKSIFLIKKIKYNLKFDKVVKSSLLISSNDPRNLSETSWVHPHHLTIPNQSNSTQIHGNRNRHQNRRIPNQRLGK